MCLSEITTDNATGETGDGRYLRHVVVAEVLVTLSTAEVPRGAEGLPQLTGYGLVAHHHRLSTHVEAISRKSSVSQHTDSEGRTDY